MARFYSDFPLSGRHGNVVYFTRNGKTFMKEYKKPKDPKTTKQLSSRARLRAAVNFLKQFKEVIRRGYQAPLNYTLPFMEAQRFVIDSCLIPVDPPTDGNEFQFEIDIPTFKLSRGKITPPEITSIDRNGNELILTWNKSLGPPPNRLYDSMNVVAYLPGKKAVWLSDLGTRQSGEVKSTLPLEIGQPAHFWVFFSNEHKSVKPNQENTSYSVYLGVF